MGRVDAWLEDIVRCIDEIFSFLPTSKNFHEYQKDIRTKKAIERNIEIIGEAINRISKNESCDIQIKNARKIIGTRNRLAHEYDNISDEIIWAIVLRELPKLKKEIEELMHKDSQS